MYWNNERTHSGISNMTPGEKLKSLGYVNAEAIGNFPTFVLEDIHQELYRLPDFMELQVDKYGGGEVLYQNVLTPYRM